MSRITKSLAISLALLSMLNLASCNDDDVYQAPPVTNTFVVQVGDAQGSPATGWTVNDLQPGTYDLEFYTRSAQTDVLPYVTASGKMTAVKPSASWSKNVVKGIQVTDGTCQISLGNGTGVEIGNMQLLSSTQQPFNLIKGGDVSLLNYIEDNGGAYFYADGRADDCLEILKQNGINLVRLRLYNDPGNKDFSPSNNLPAGYQDEDDILDLARRAKEKGMQIQLTFHYSDSWTNGEDQYKPHEWKGLELEELKQAVHDYTADFLNQMAAQGTLPEYVAIGNEVQAGLLYPDGACANEQAMCDLLNAGAKAVREVAPSSRIIIHSASQTGAQAETGLTWFFGVLRDYSVDYDIMGISAYPFYTQMYASDFCNMCDRLIGLFGKDIILMETAYAWNATLPDGSVGQIANNGPYNEFSKLGQRDFIADLSNQIKQTTSGRVLGYIYWDPIFIDVPGLGYILGAKNVVSNSTLFDFDGKALPVLDAIKYNN